MSKFIPPDYLDDRSKIIVHGYIGKFRKLLSSSLFNYIPREISIITLCYIDDYFMMNRGTYEWKITDLKLIQNVLTAENNQRFTSTVFTIGKLSWLMRVYPNGHVDTNAAQGDFGIFIEILSWPTSWKSIYVLLIIKVNEMNKTFSSVSCYTGQDYWGKNDILALSDLIVANPKQLTFTVSLKILRIVEMNNEIKYQFGVNNYRKNYKLKWKVNPNQMTVGPQYSDIIDEMFCAFYSGINSEITLRICGLPNKKQTGYNIEINALQIKWSVCVNNCDIKYTMVAKLGYAKKFKQLSHISLPILQLNEWKKNEEIKLEIDI
eukprot:212513_1